MFMAAENINQTLPPMIQEVPIRLAGDGEILVKMPKSIFNYYKDMVGYRNAFTKDFWYSTGAIGEKSDDGVKVLREKYPQVGLYNDESLISSGMKLTVEGKCHYIAGTLIMGAGGDFPVAILFPNVHHIDRPDYEISPLEGCFCPRDMHELGKCLGGCLNQANNEIGQRFPKIKSFLIAYPHAEAPAT